MLLITQAAWAGDVIDRIVATVNGHIILQSDWDEEVAYEALMDGKSVQKASDEDRLATLNRLVDQELIRQQVRPTDSEYVPDQQVIDGRIQSLRKQLPNVETDKSWNELLARYNLNETDVKAHIAMQFRILHIIDDHLTPTIQIDDKSVEDYYNQTLLPQLRQSGAKEPPLTEVTPKIREILTQQKLNDALKDWLQSLRDDGTIHLQTAPATTGGQPH